MANEERQSGVLRWKPAASKKVLLAAGGCLWACAGAMLAVRGYGMLAEGTSRIVMLESIASLAGVVLFVVMFRSVADRYIARIIALGSERPCFFALMSTRAYFVMAFMITLGITLRNIPGIPRADLGTVYAAIAVPLLFSSARFFRESLSRKGKNLPSAPNGGAESSEVQQKQ